MHIFKKRFPTLMRLKGWMWAILLFGFLVSQSCRRDDGFRDTPAQLSFSVDTLLFDTVFTSVGSATRILKIFNNESELIRLNIFLESGNTSFFRFNADGVKGPIAENIEILGRDSVYVFIEVTIDPDNPLSISPFIVEDNLIIEQGGAQRNIVLAAYGQNANYVPGVNRKASLSLLSCNLGTVVWDDPKPYVVYGILFVDSCELVLPKNTRLYVHGGIVINEDFIYNEGLITIMANGKLTVNGSVSEPVVIQADRLEPSFANTSGQWVGIRFLAGSKDNSINHAIIRNGIVGVRVDSSAELSLKNVVIENTIASGIIGIHSKIYGENLLIHNTGQHSVQLVYGGDYEFNYSTFASYTNNIEALYLDNVFCPFPQCAFNEFRINAAKLRITNTAIVGSRNDEIRFFDIFEKQEPSMFDFDMSHNVLRVRDFLNPENYPNFFNNCTNCYNINPSDRLFRSVAERNFRPDSLSVLLQRGIPIPDVNLDIEGNVRDNSSPTVGCFEL
jgi:hypothetical protein